MIRFFVDVSKNSDAPSSVINIELGVDFDINAYRKKEEIL